MRYSLITASVAFAMLASPAFAEIMSCSYDAPAPARMAPPPGAKPPAPPAGKTAPAKPGEKPVAATPPGAPVPPGAPAAAPGGRPPAPGMMGRPVPVSAPTVETKLNCISGTTKGESTLSELSAKGWKLQTSASFPGNVTFYLVK